MSIARKGHQACTQNSLNGRMYAVYKVINVFHARLKSEPRRWLRDMLSVCVVGAWVRVCVCVCVCVRARAREVGTRGRVCMFSGARMRSCVCACAFF